MNAQQRVVALSRAGLSREAIAAILDTDEETIRNVTIAAVGAELPAGGGGGSAAEVLNLAAAASAETSVSIADASLVQIDFEGVLTPPDGSRDRFILLRPSAASLGEICPVAWQDTWMDAVADGHTDITAYTKDGFLIGSTGFQVECSLTGRAILQVARPSFARRVCNTMLSIVPNGGDTRVLVGHAASYWPDNTTDLEGLFFDFDGALFTGTIAVTPL